MVKDSGARDGKASEELSTNESSVSNPAITSAFWKVDKLFSMAEVTLCLTVDLTPLFTASDVL